MTIPTDNTPTGESGRDKRSGSTDTSLACITMYAPSAVLFLGYVYSQLSRLDQRMQALEKHFSHIGAMVDRQNRRDEQHVTVLAACQRDTAKALDRALERHALHPAIEAAAALAEELSRLQDSASQRDEGGAGGDEVDELGAQIEISCTVARERLANLDVQRIAPAERAKLDAQMHMVCGYVETADENLHGRISRLLTPGIAYRGKVLRQARVTVFRRNPSGNQHS